MRHKCNISEKQTMTKKTSATKTDALSFEASLDALEGIVTHLEAGNLPLEEALAEFERGIALTRTSQKTLMAAEQRVQILLNDDENAPLSDFTPEND